MNNNSQLFNFPLASFTFGKDEQKIENNNYINDSNSLYMNVQSNLNNNKNQIKSSHSHDYFQTNKNNKFNNSFSNNVQKMIELNKNKDNINNYNNSNYFSSNQNTKMITLNYGGELTFGQSNELLKNINNENNNSDDINNIDNNTLKNNYFINDNYNKNNNFINVNENVILPIFVDETNNDINSYIKVILYTIFHLKHLRNYIINIGINNEGNINNDNSNIIFALKEIFQQVENNSKINIRNLKDSLSYQFKNKRKFILNHPDDPIDLLFVILNAIHSFYIKCPLNEISDELCNLKCFSHKFIWMDLTRIDECECNGTSRRLFSNHNYITDIPMNQIFSLINNIYKNNPNFILAENYQKLFYYYKEILHNINMNCPLNGNRCNVNKTHHRLYLANSPSYFIFNLVYNQNNNINNIFNNYSLLNILKCFVLMSKNFDIPTIFEENIRNKNDYNLNKNYNLIGIIFLSFTKIYSCAFKSPENNKLYNYYTCDNNCIFFNSFYELVFYSLKNGLIPIMLLYQENNIDIRLYDNINNINDNLTKEQIIQLEKYSINNDNLLKIIFQNKIRTNENILTSFTESNNYNNKINPNNFIHNTSIKNNKKISNSQMDLLNIKNDNIFNNNNFDRNYIQQYKSNTYKIRSNKNRNKLQNNEKDDRSERLSLQNQKNYFKNKLNDFNIDNNNDNNYYLINNINNFNTNDGSMDVINDNNKKTKKFRNEQQGKNDHINRVQKINNEQHSHSNLDMPVPFIPYKKDMPITLLPIQGQNSIEVNIKNNSNNYFYKNNIYNIKSNNTPLNNIKKNGMKQKSNSYSKNNNNVNYKSIINQISLNNNSINHDYSNISNDYDFKNRNIINKELKLNSGDFNSENINKNLYNNYNNPNSFNKNNNIRNKIKNSGRKGDFNKINKSNFDLSSNRQSNFRYEKNISNLSNNQNNRHISDEISSEDIKKKFSNKKLINQVINYSNSKIKNNIDVNINSNKKLSKSDDNTNSNIYNFNYIYNNNNFDMNILGNNVDNNIYKNNNIINKSYDNNANDNIKNDNIIINNIKNQSQNIIKNNEGHWTCDYCSNINRDDFIYCKICKRNKNGKLLKINTQIFNNYHNQKKNTKAMTNRTNTNTHKKSKIIKNKNIPKSNNNINNNKNMEMTMNKNHIKKINRNTITGFSSSKNFYDNENYNNFIKNNEERIKDFNNNNMDNIKKEYSFSKASFDNRKYNIY